MVDEERVSNHSHFISIGHVQKVFECVHVYPQESCG